MTHRSFINGIPALSLLLLGLVPALLSPTPASAIVWSNQFTQFELPPLWQCNLEGAEWVCQSTEEGKKKDAIIVLAAKLKGDQDSLDQYLAYLKAPKTYTSVQGRSVKSDVKYANTKNIGGQVWVDSLHMESEIPGFYTRYLATVRQDIGVLVTYSINKNKYQDYQRDFETMVNTLKVFRKSGGLNVATGNPQQSLFDRTNIPSHVSDTSVFPAAPQGGSDAPPPAPKQEDDSMLYILIAAAVVGFLIWKKKRAG